MYSCMPVDICFIFAIRLVCVYMCVCACVNRCIYVFVASGSTLRVEVNSCVSLASIVIEFLSKKHIRQMVLDTSPFVQLD